MLDTKKIIGNLIGNKAYGGKNDIDGDGVTNRKDCQPRNAMRQDKTSYDFDESVQKESDNIDRIRKKKYNFKDSVLVTFDN